MRGYIIRCVRRRELSRLRRAYAITTVIETRRMVRWCVECGEHWCARERNDCKRGVRGELHECAALKRACIMVTYTLILGA